MSTTPPRVMTAHNNLHSLLFQATSAEYAALCVQAYTGRDFVDDARYAVGD